VMRNLRILLSASGADRAAWGRHLLVERELRTK
jgi:hypothetical protein